jgi:hypothetical protein
MKTLWLTALLLCSRLLGAFDPASAATELRRLGQQLNDGKQASVLAALPLAWEVATPTGKYTVSSAPLRTLLENPAKNTSEAKAWLEYLAAHLDGFSMTSQTPRDARRSLERILARSEFAGVGPPSAMELLRLRIIAWFAALLQRIFAFVGAESVTGMILCWALLAAAVGGLGFLVLRLWMRDELAVSLTSDGRRTRARTWHDWIETARSAAEQGDWRRAVQCAYWAGIVRMEETGALPRDRTQTPREYLRLLTPPPPGAPSPSAQPLADLTTRLERFWYRRLTADAEDFAACLDSLEALGCRVR